MLLLTASFKGFENRMTDLQVTPTVIISYSISCEVIKPGVQGILPRLTMLESLHLHQIGIVKIHVTIHHPGVCMH